ncbi:MAG: mRNA surveillance protein pelota [Candidatus Ranarchaeia archaeon]
MQILHQDRTHGKIKVLPNTLDDLWHLYQVIEIGDTVEGATFRRIRQSPEDARRPDKGERKRVFLSIEVDDIDFHEFSDALRIKGVIKSSSDEAVSIGLHHTFNVTVGNPITIIKKDWSRLAITRLKKAVADTKKAQLGILAIEEGQCQLATVTNIGINPGPSITMAIPGKRAKGGQHDKVFNEFLNSVVQILHEYVLQKQAGKIVIVGPGSTKNKLYTLLQKRHPALAKNVILENASSGTIQGVNEAIRRGNFLNRISELDILANTKKVELVLEHIAKDTGLAVYGEKEVHDAIRRGAVKELLISEANLRLANPKTRKQVEAIVRLAEQLGAQVHFISPLYPAGKQLESLGGFAAILRFRSQ